MRLFFILTNHGPIICGRTLAEATTAVEILEKAAMSYIFGSLIGGCKSIPEEFIQEERDCFLHRYGKAADGALE